MIEQFKQNGPGRGPGRRRARGAVRDLETNSERNDYLLNRILFKYEFGEDVQEVFNMRPFYDQLTVRRCATRRAAYLNTNRYVEVTLMPESR